MSVPRELAGLGARSLLVVSDYDGTLAPIVTNPDAALPQEGAREALTALVEAGHEVAVLTGRGAAQVRAFLNLPGLTVIGLHGMEWPGETPPAPDVTAIREITARVPPTPGLRLEDKGRTLAVHYREVAPHEQVRVEAALEALTLPPGWELMRGKLVREFRPAGFGKGRALARLRAAFPDRLAVFLGDDATDEEGFEVLRREGVTVKVGEGLTLAEHRVADPATVVELMWAWTRRERRSSSSNQIRSD
ncbi:trehalose-phosphatase [Deinococcus pimensis]|uniref:trehalose-phosphatase n=1 Tax=Deinococcus pimensis TaxID=309888 RepID=UPI0004B56539|nr:trehalose-phosphatase [Deinococcus pimensis]